LLLDVEALLLGIEILLLEVEVLMLEVETLLLQVDILVLDDCWTVLDVEISVLDDCWTVLVVEISVLLDGTITVFETAAAAAGLKRYKSSLVLYKLSFLIKVEARTHLLDPPQYSDELPVQRNEQSVRAAGILSFVSSFDKWEA